MPTSTTLAAPPLRPRRRLRADARLARLTPAQRERLHTWLDRENRPYVAVVQLLLSEFGVVTSKSALGVYYRRFILPEHSEEDPELAACLAALQAGHRDPYTLYRAQVHAYQALARPDPQIRTAEKLLHYLHRARKQDLTRQRLALKRERAALRQQELAAQSHRSPGDGGCPLPASTSSSPLALPHLAAPSVKADAPSPQKNPSRPPDFQPPPPSAPPLPLPPHLRPLRVPHLTSPARLPTHHPPPTPRSLRSLLFHLHLSLSPPPRRLSVSPLSPSFSKPSLYFPKYNACCSLLPPPPQRLTK